MLCPYCNSVLFPAPLCCCIHPRTTDCLLSLIIFYGLPIQRGSYNLMDEWMRNEAHGADGQTGNTKKATFLRYSFDICLVVGKQVQVFFFISGIFCLSSSEGKDQWIAQKSTGRISKWYPSFFSPFVCWKVGGCNTTGIGEKEAATAFATGNAWLCRWQLLADQLVFCVPITQQRLECAGLCLVGKGFEFFMVLTSRNVRLLFLLFFEAEPRLL